MKAGKFGIVDNTGQHYGHFAGKTPEAAIQKMWEKQERFHPEAKSAEYFIAKKGSRTYQIDNILLDKE